MLRSQQIKFLTFCFFMGTKVFFLATERLSKIHRPDMSLNSPSIF